MKKSYNPTDLHKQEGQEQSKKLYRTISETAKRLDDARSCARNVTDLFTPSLQIQRSKFREFCERLIFSDPVFFGRKAEELLWRKGYYDVVSSTKRLKKQEYSSAEISNLQAHINAGIGHYHHFISRLQCEFDVNLKGIIDFIICQGKQPNQREQKAEVTDWAEQSIHRSLIYLGDLSRYKLEIYPNWDPGLAIRYYLQASSFKPDYGMPHNQLGTLSSSQNHTLDAVYYYIRCLSCKHIFEGTENNLRRLLDKNSQVLEQLSDQNSNNLEPEPNDHIKKFVVRFLLLADIWFFDKNSSNIYNICHQTNIHLQECLMHSQPIPSESGDTHTDLDSLNSDSTSYPSYLNDEIIFKVNIICLLCISKLQLVQSQQISTAVAFTLAVYSQLVQNATDHIKERILNSPISDSESENDKNHLENDPIKKKITRKKKTNLLRRRKKINSNSDDSEISEPEEIIDSSSDESVEEFQIDQVHSSVSEDESDDENFDKNSSSSKTDVSQVNGKLDLEKSEIVDESKMTANVIDKAKRMNPEALLEIIGEEGLLQSVKILSDWLISDVEVLKSCGRSTRSLLKQIVQLLNLVNVDLDNSVLVKSQPNIQNIKANEKKIPLPEDVTLKGVEILSNTQNDIQWDYLSLNVMTSKEETLLRILKLVSFGNFLTQFSDTGVSYDAVKKMYTIEEIVENSDCNGVIIDDTQEPNEPDNNTTLLMKKERNKENVETKGQLMKMKHMGQLWLASEVQALESRVRGKTSLSPYLVLDVEALIKFRYVVKQLMYSKKFIVLVPAAVVSALDDLKREKMDARDAIRWLELQFHQGNRFFRAQRPHERAALPLIKYPKKKDKEMFVYIQIIECCYYLTQQQKGASNLVTLLLGNENALSNAENREISYVGLARSVGINIEMITEFYGKWKKIRKGKR